LKNVLLNSNICNYWVKPNIVTKFVNQNKWLESSYVKAVNVLTKSVRITVKMIFLRDRFLLAHPVVLLAMLCFPVGSKANISYFFKYCVGCAVGYSLTVLLIQWCANDACASRNSLNMLPYSCNVKKSEFKPELERCYCHIYPAESRHWVAIGLKVLAIIECRHQRSHHSGDDSNKRFHLAVECQGRHSHDITVFNQPVIDRVQIRESQVVQQLKTWQCVANE